MTAPSIAADQAAGIPVARSVYGMTEADIRNTLVKIAQYIREGARTPSIQKIAASAVDRRYPRRQRTTSLQVAQVLLDYVRENVRYRPDPKMVEMVKSPKITLCADDAPICIPVEDCDGLVSAYGALLGSMGVDVLVLVQDYGSQQEQHVLILFQNDDGEWLTADPSSRLKQIGAKDYAEREYTVDPLNPEQINMPSAPQGEFITVGANKKKSCCSNCEEGKPCGGETLGMRPAVDASLGAVSSTGLIGGATIGLAVGGVGGGLVGYKLAGKASTGWKVFATVVGVLLGSNLGAAVGAGAATAAGGP